MNRSRCSLFGWRSRRGGFTLLEVLIALSLMSVLIFLIASLMSTFSKAQLQADRIESRMQLARRLRYQLERDLQRIKTTGSPVDSGSEIEVLSGNTTDVVSDGSGSGVSTSGVADESFSPGGTTANEGLVERRGAIRLSGGNVAHFHGDATQLTFDVWLEAGPEQELERLLDSLHDSALPGDGADDESLLGDDSNRVLDGSDLFGGDDLFGDEESGIGGASRLGEPLRMLGQAQVTYRLSQLQLVDADELSEGEAASSYSFDEDSLLPYELVREVVVEEADPGVSDIGESVDPDELLDASDLYRQTDEAVADESLGNVSTSRLGPIANAKFRYSDGSGWKTQWDSQQMGRLPIAIELTFDFLPSQVADYRESLEPVSAEFELDEEDEGFLGDDEERLGLESEPLLDGDDLMGDETEIPETEYRLVILLEAARWTTPPPVSGESP